MIRLLLKLLLSLHGHLFPSLPFDLIEKAFSLKVEIIELFVKQVNLFDIKTISFSIDQAFDGV
jgi:hypothetical protein